MRKEFSEPPSRFLPTDDSGGIDPDDLREEIEWRMRFVGGYCASTSEPHEPDDFEESTEGWIGRLTRSTDAYVCEDCGLRVSTEEYHRLKELSSLRGDLEGSVRGMEIRLDG